MTRPPDPVLTPEAGVPAHDLAMVMWRIRSDWRISWDREAECWQVFRRGADPESGRRFADRSDALRYYLAEAGRDAEELARWAGIVDAGPATASN